MGKYFEGLAQIAQVRQHLYSNIDKCADPAAHDDDPQPIDLGSAAKIVQHGNQLQNEAVGKVVSEKTHGVCLEYNTGYRARG